MVTAVGPALNSCHGEADLILTATGKTKTFAEMAKSWETCSNVSMPEPRVFKKPIEKLGPKYGDNPVTPRH